MTRNLIIVFLLLMMNCQSITPRLVMDPEYGDIEGNLYESEKGRFVCYVPVDARYAVMEDGYYKVSFHQTGIGLFKIQSIKMKPDFLKTMKEEGREEALKNFISTNLLTKLQQKAPQANIQVSEYYKTFRDGAYFFILNIPNLSKSAQMKSTFYENYAMVTFVVGNFIYILTRDVPSAPTENNSPNDTNMIVNAQARLIEFHSRILILGDDPTMDLSIDAFDLEADGEEGDEEEEELAGGSSGGASGSIDLGGILQLLQKRLYVPKGKMDIKPGRFKFNSARFNSNKFKMSGRTHIKPARFKMKSSFKVRGFKR